MSTTPRATAPLTSSIARSTATTVHVHGQDLIGMLGTVSFGDFAYLSLFRRLPDERESVLFNALLVTLVEHGITPSTMATRLTYLGAPESLQGAVAAGLLGLGNTFVGTIEGAARLCQDRLPGAGADAAAANKLDDAALDVLAADIAAEFAAERRAIPGLGHPVHKPVDPRAQRLFALGRELGFDDSATKLMERLSSIASASRGKDIPVNATGAIGALASTLGLDWSVSRGLGIMARSVGLVGHILEEREAPMATSLWYRAEDEVSAH